MKYWLLLGLHTRRFAPWIRPLLARLPAHELVVVETGAAMGAWDAPGHVLACEERGVVPFLRTAMEYVRSVAGPDDWFVRIDADDYYGPGYLDEIEKERLAGSKATGIRDVFVRTEGNELYFCKGRGVGVPGGTLAGEIASAPDFLDTGLPWGEDSSWCHAAKISHRSGRGYAMLRWEGHEHTFPVTGDELPHVWFCEASLAGHWSEGVVNGDIVPALTPVERNPWLVSSAANRTIQLGEAWQRDRR